MERLLVAASRHIKQAGVAVVSVTRAVMVVCQVAARLVVFTISRVAPGTAFLFRHLPVAAVRKAGVGAVSVKSCFTPDSGWAPVRQEAGMIALVVVPISSHSLPTFRRVRRGGVTVPSVMHSR